MYKRYENTNNKCDLTLGAFQSSGGDNNFQSAPN